MGSHDGTCKVERHASLAGNNAQQDIEPQGLGAIGLTLDQSLRDLSEHSGLHTKQVGMGRFLPGILWCVLTGWLAGPGVWLAGWQQPPVAASDPVLEAQWGCAVASKPDGLLCCSRRWAAMLWYVSGCGRLPSAAQYV